MADKFDRSKEERLSSVDLSRKGSIDSAILELVEFINNSSDYFTTSSCSGRIIIVQNPTSDHGPRKKGCKWRFTSHDPAAVKDVMDSLLVCEEDLVLKFEPFIMHVQCRALQHAQAMHSAAVASGFRNSGITVGSKGKIMAAVRSSHGLEVPLSQDGQLLVSEQYITFLVQVANQKMEENFKRINRFFQAVRGIESLEKVPENVKSRRKTKASTETDTAGSDHCDTTVKHEHIACDSESTEDLFYSCIALLEPS